MERRAIHRIPGAAFDSIAIRTAFVAILVLLEVRIGAGDTGEYRSFTSSDGKKIEARAIGFADDTVKIQLKDGRKFDLPVSRLVAEDQEWVAKWRKEFSDSYKPELRIGFDENIEQSTEESGFVHVQKLKPSLVITNREGEFDLEDASATILVVIEDLEAEDSYKVLSKQTADFSVGAGETKELEWTEAETKYATIRAYGFKYAGYSVIIQNSSGTIVASAGSRGWDKNPEKALESAEGASVKEDFAESE